MPAFTNGACGRIRPVCTYSHHAIAGTVWTSLDVATACRYHRARFTDLLSELAPDAGQDRWHATTVLAWLGN